MVAIAAGSARGRGGAAVSSGRRRPDQIPGGHHGLTPEEVADSQRQRILAAMRATVVEHGYSGASVADVIKRAGVSRKTFYAQFADKEDCFLTIYDDRMGRLQAATRAAFDAQDEWVPALRAGLTALLDALAHEPEIARLLFVDVLAAGPRAAAARNGAMRELAAIFALDGGEGGAAADGAAAPRALGMSLVGGLVEVLYQELVDDRAEQLPRMLPELMYALTLPVAGAEVAERELRRGERRRSRA